NIESREKEEEKKEAENKKARIKEIKKYDKQQKEETAIREKGAEIADKQKSEIAPLKEKIERNKAYRMKEEMDRQKENLNKLINELEKYNIQSTQNIHELIDEHVRREKMPAPNHVLYNEHTTLMSEHISKFLYDEHREELLKNPTRNRRSN